MGGRGDFLFTHSDTQTRTQTHTQTYTKTQMSKKLIYSILPKERIIVKIIFLLDEKVMLDIHLPIHVH